MLHTYIILLKLNHHRHFIYSFVGPDQPVSGACEATTVKSEKPRSMQFCDASTGCLGNVEELFFNRDLKKSDASVDWLV